MSTPRSPSTFSIAGVAARSGAASTTLPIPADATTRPCRSTRMKRRRGAWRVSKISAIRRDCSACPGKNLRSNIRSLSTCGVRLMSDSRMAPQRESASGQGGIEPLLSGYRPLPGIFDEMVDRDGRVRAHWQPLLAMLARLGPNEIGRRFAAADRHLRDSGVFYRVYEDASGAERP